MDLYIAVPWDGSDTNLDEWGRSGNSCPKYLQRRTSPYDGNNYFYTDGLNVDYCDQLLQVDGSQYVVYYINSSSVYTGNESDLNNTLLHNASSTYNIQGSRLPLGTKVWEFDHWSTFDCPIGFGADGGVYGVLVAVYSEYTVPEDYNSWLSRGSGVYEFNANANSIFNITNYPEMEKMYSLSKDTQYTFTMYTTSEENWDGIIISHTRLTTMSSGQISNFGAARCSGNGVTQTYTYTPSSNETIYFYFRTDGSTLNPNPSFGRITITKKSKNTIYYLPYNNTCYTSSSSQQVDIASGSSCLSGSTLSFTTSRWSISSNGRYLTIPANTAEGTYGVTITVTSPNSGNFYSVTETRSITITISANTIVWGSVLLVDATNQCYDETFTFTGYCAMQTEDSNGNPYWEVFTDYVADTGVEPVDTGVADTGVVETDEPIEYIPMFFETIADEPEPGGTDYVYHYLPASAYTVNGNNIEDYVTVLVSAIQSYWYSSDPYTIYWTEITNKSWIGSISGNSLGTTETGQTYVDPSNMSLIFKPNDYSEIEVPLDTGNFSLQREANVKTRTSGSCWYNGSTNFPAAGGDISFNKSNVSVLEEFSYTSGATSSNTTVNSFSCARTSAATGWNFGRTGNTSDYTYTVSAPPNNSTDPVTNGTVIEFKINGLERSYTFTQSGKSTPTLTLVANPAETAKVTISVAGTVYWGTSSSSMTNTKSVSANTQTTLTSSSGGTLTIYVYFVPTDTGNYTSLGNSSTPTASVTITKKIQITSIAPSTSSSSRKVIYNRSGYNTFTITVSPSGATVSFTSSDSSKATVSSAGLVTYVSAGDLTITVTGTGDYEGTQTCYVRCVVDTEGSTQYKNSACTTQGVNISSYGTPTVSIASALAAGRFVEDGSYGYYDGGSATVTTSVTNNTQWYQKWASGYVQSHTGTQAGSVNLSITANGNNRFTLSGTTITHDWMKDYIGTDTVTVKATNAGSSSKYASASKSITNGIDSYGEITYVFNDSSEVSKSEVSLVQYADLPVTALTLSTSNIENYFKLERTLDSSAIFDYARQNAYYTSGWVEPNHVNGVWSGNSTSLSTLGTTATNRASVNINPLTLTFTGSGGYTDTFSTGSSAYRAANQVTGYTDYQNPTGLTISASVVPASGGTATITWSGTCKQNAKAVYTSGATASSYTSLTISSPTKSISGNGSVSSKGTTISNQTSVKTVTGTYSANGKSSTTTCSVYQAGNYVTAITPKSSSNTDGTHFSYANIGAGATSASPSLTGGALYTFSSGSTAFDSSSSPSFGGSSSYSRSYTLASSQNGFTAVNSSTGVLTATSRGTTAGAARTSANVTGTLVVTYTHASSYSAGGTVTSSTKSNTQTCTQNANALESISLSVATNPINYNTTTTCSVSATYTSGSSKDVTSSLVVNASSGNRIVVGDTTIISIT